MTHPQAQAPLNMPDPEVRERTTPGGNGWPIAIVSIVAILAGLAMTVWSIFVLVDESFGLGFALLIGGPLVVLITSFVAAGLTPVAPGESRVLQLFGHYKGTIRRQGLRWVNPLTMRRKVSTRIRNHETEVAKVNDLDGNPIEIAAVVVWQVEDTAMAVFEVDDFTEFVAIQTETAVRHIANGYPYDAHEAGQMSLRDNAEEITLRLSEEIGDRVESAGVRIIESRITHLAYAPEIAQAMLRRQQAGAVVAARQRIVQGAVGMVESALAQLSEDNVVELDEERKAAMVSNMLVVLCSEHSTQPVINTGSLYQ